MTSPVVSSLQIIVPCPPRRIWQSSWSCAFLRYSHSCKGKWKCFLNLWQHKKNKSKQWKKLTFVLDNSCWTHDFLLQNKMWGFPYWLKCSIFYYIKLCLKGSTIHSSTSNIFNQINTNTSFCLHPNLFHHDCADTVCGKERQTTPSTVLRRWLSDAHDITSFQPSPAHFKPVRRTQKHPTEASCVNSRNERKEMSAGGFLRSE